MKVRTLMSALAPLAAAAAMLAAGCSQQQQQVVKKEPAPATQPAAPKAAPVAGCTGLAFPTGDRATSAVFLETAMPAQVRANQPFNYDITVTNLTNMSLQNVMVTASNFQNLNITSSNPSGTAGQGGMSWAVGELGPKQNKKIQVTATAPATGTSANCFTVSYNNYLCCTTQVVNPALALTKRGPSEVLLCDAFDYTLEVKNSGTGTAENVVIRDALPQGLTTIDGKQTVEIPVGALAAGQSSVKTIRVKASKTGQYQNAADAKADGGLTVNSGPITTTVRQPQLTIAATCSQQVFIGRDACFDFTVKNTGDAACSGTLSATVPGGSTFASATENGAAAGANVNWRVENLAPGASKTVRLCVRPAPTASSLTSSATVSCPCSNPATAQCTTQVVGIPAQLLDGVDNPDPVQVGQNVTYTLTVTNQGSAPLTNVKLIGTMDTGSMQYVTSTGPTQASVSGAAINFAPIATLAPKQQHTFTITVKATKAGQVSFKAESSSDQITKTLIKTETTNFYE